MASARKASVGWVRDMEDLRTVLRSFTKEQAAVILEKGIKAACGPILVAAKRFAKRSERTGSLRNSLVIKTVAYKQSGKAVGLVGPDKKYYVRGKQVKKLRALFGARSGALRRPANYAHLVEFGHRVAKGGSLRAKHELTLVGIGRYGSQGKELKRWKRGRVIEESKGTAAGFVAPKPFLRPAVITTRGQQATAFQQGISAALDAHLRRNNRAAGARVRYKTAA